MPNDEFKDLMYAAGRGDLCIVPGAEQIQLQTSGCGCCTSGFHQDELSREERRMVAKACSEAWLAWGEAP